MVPRRPRMLRVLSGRFFIESSSLNFFQVFTRTTADTPGFIPEKKKIFDDRKKRCVRIGG